MSDPLSVMSAAARGQNTRPHVDVETLDMVLATRILEFYTTHPFIRVCRDRLMSLIFTGGMRTTWGDGAADIELEASAREELQNLLETALDYRLMYNMVPIIVSKPRGLRASAGDPSQSSGSRRKRAFPVTIPSIGTGSFIAENNRITGKTAVFFEITTSATGISAAQANTKVKRVPVFVWPGGDPIITTHAARGDEGAKPVPSSPMFHFRSVIMTLLDSHFMMLELKTNLLEADYSTAHPTIVTQAHPQKVDPTSLTEEETYADIDDPAVVTPENAVRYRRDIDRAFRLEARAAEMNAAARGAATASDKREIVDAGTGALATQTRIRGFAGSMFQLNEGEQQASGVTASYSNDFVVLQQQFEHLVCTSIGLPSALISQTTARYKPDADQDRATIHTTVTQHRKASVQFYEFMYDLLWRDLENETLVRALLMLDARTPDTTAGNDKSTHALRDRVKNVALMRHRASIEFTVEPAPILVAREIIIAGAARGAFTREEEIAMWRAQAGLPEHRADADTDSGAAAQRPQLTLGELAGARIGVGAIIAPKAPVASSTPAPASASAAAAAAASAAGAAKGADSEETKEGEGRKTAKKGSGKDKETRKRDDTDEADANKRKKKKTKKK